MFKLKKILDVASTAAKMILENGGETYRSEDVVTRICDSYDVTSDCFAILSGIMVSISRGEESISTVIRIHKRTINLDKIHQINDLVVNAENIKPDEFLDKLQEIKESKRYPKWLTFLAYATTAACFSILFGGTYKDFAATLPVGGLLYILSYSFSKYELNGIFVNTFGGALCVFSTHFLESLHLIDTPDSVIIGSLMVLVPGIALTNGIRDIIAGDFVAGIARSSEALLIAISLAVGTGIAVSLFSGGPTL